MQEFSMIVVVFLILLAILWFLLPFAVFGIKSRLDEMIVKMDTLIEIQNSLVRTTKKQSTDK